MTGRDWRTEESKELLRGLLRGMQAEILDALERNKNKQPHTEWGSFSLVTATIVRTEEEFKDLDAYLTHCQTDPNADAMFLMQFVLMGAGRVICGRCGHVHQGLSDGTGVLRCGHDVVTTDAQWKEHTGKTTFQTTVCMCNGDT